MNSFPASLQVVIGRIKASRYIPPAPAANVTPQEQQETVLRSGCRLFLGALSKVQINQAVPPGPELPFSDQQLKQLLLLDSLIPANEASNTIQAVQIGSEFVFDAVLISSVLDYTLAQQNSFLYNRCVFDFIFCE